MDNINADVQRDAIEALTSLGYSPSQAVAAVKNICKSNSTINNAGELIKLALKSIAL